MIGIFRSFQARQKQTMSEVKELWFMRSISMFKIVLVCFRIETDGRRITYFVVFTAVAFTTLTIVTCFILIQHRTGMKNSVCHTFIFMRMEEFCTLNYNADLKLDICKIAWCLDIFILTVLHIQWEWLFLLWWFLFFQEFTQEHSTHI